MLREEITDFAKHSILNAAITIALIITTIVANWHANYLGFVIMVLLTAYYSTFCVHTIVDLIHKKFRKNNNNE